MKKFFSIMGIATCAILVLLNGLVACSNDFDESISGQELSQNEEKLEEYFKTSDYSIFLKTNHVTEENVNMTNITKESYNKKGTEIFTIPIEKKGKTIGKLYVIAYRNTFKTIYEDWTEATEGKEKGLVRVSTGEGEFIATLNIERKNGKLYSHIDQVAENVITRAEGESWWGCTTRVYREAKKACGSSDTCNFLCDITDTTGAGQCTLSTAAAAAIACAIYG